MNIYPYKPASKGAKDLAEALGVRRIKHRSSRFRASPQKVVVNWGCGADNWPRELNGCRIINNPAAVSLCSNKLSFFRNVSEAEQGPRVPPFLTSRQDVIQRLSGGAGVEWVARTVLQGHSGAGIILINGDTPPEDVPQASLYTKYIKKTDEYRVHIFQGEVIDVQRKARSMDVPDDQVNWQVRNHANGFIFARNEGQPVPADVAGQSLLCMRAVGLDFGAVDVVYNGRREEAYVIEVNTAPGLVGTTLENYTRKFREVR